MVPLRRLQSFIDGGTKVITGDRGREGAGWKKGRRGGKGNKISYGGGGCNERNPEASRMTKSVLPQRWEAGASFRKYQRPER